MYGCMGVWAYGMRRDWGCETWEKLKLRRGAFRKAGWTGWTCGLGCLGGLFGLWAVDLMGGLGGLWTWWTVDWLDFV